MMADRPTERPKSYTIGVCSGCRVQSPPHVVGCPEASRPKWYRTQMIEVLPNLAKPAQIKVDHGGREIELRVGEQHDDQFIIELLVDGMVVDSTRWQTHKSEDR